MNMKKTFGVKRLTALLFPLALAVVLLACGGTGSPADDPDPYHIGNFAGIEVRVAPGVDRAHGEHALDRLQAFDVNEDQGFPGGGRVASFSGGVINKIIVISVPVTPPTVRHIGGGVLEVRLNSLATGGISAILSGGRSLIENNIIGGYY